MWAIANVSTVKCGAPCWRLVSVRGAPAPAATGNIHDIYIPAPIRDVALISVHKGGREAPIPEEHQLVF